MLEILGTRLIKIISFGNKFQTIFLKKWNNNIYKIIPIIDFISIWIRLKKRVFWAYDFQVKGVGY